jgi:hypothetical protein
MKYQPETEIKYDVECNSDEIIKSSVDTEKDNDTNNMIKDSVHE